MLVRWLVSGAVLVGWASGVVAEPIVIESHVGQASASSDAQLAPLYAELGRRGYLSGPALAKRVEAEISTTGEVLDAGAVSGAIDLTEQGYAAFMDARFDDAVRDLTKVLAHLASRPATVAEQQSLRDTVMRAQIGLALAHHRRGESDNAVAVMAELLRSQPDREISRKTYGPEALRLAQSVRAELERRPRGALHVQVMDDPGAVVFVNERYIPGNPGTETAGAGC